MALKFLLVAICLMLMAYLSKQLFQLTSRMREAALDDRRRNAVDWTVPASRRRSKPRSRLSRMLDI